MRSRPRSFVIVVSANGMLGSAVLRCPSQTEAPRRSLQNQHRHFNKVAYQRRDRGALLRANIILFVAGAEDTFFSFNRNSLVIDGWSWTVAACCMKLSMVWFFGRGGGGRALDRGP